MAMKEQFEYHSNPGHVIFGRGTIAKVPDEISRLGVSRPLVLAAKRHHRQVEALTLALGGKGAGVFHEATMHTPVHITEKALAYAKGNNADSIITIGGGSAIGLGKALSNRTSWPHIAIPTTYSGSEMTPLLGELANGKKTGTTAPRILPGTVVYDVDLTLTLPPSVSVISGFNAMAHAVEALYARQANPITSHLAQEGIRALVTALPSIAVDPNALSARSLALYGAFLSGTCLGSVDMSLHHKICHVLGGNFNLPHGELHTLVLPHALAYNAPKISNVLRILADILPENKETGGDAIQSLNVFMAQLPIPRGGMQEFGMREEHIDVAAELVVSQPYWNPRQVEQEGVQELIRRVWAGEEARADL
ncbi:hypothetical protein AYL99_08698 [Fonsecaea erecta]|uniref:Uncharacterized protein n=1 Tax=Fonsecaea erecta TaxID=1367422 RepID=A0A178ZAU4_9EURO|nr:hypothetical protein AYL99_08698 [Fonsecaea erecta]OAP56586.1 hypothetical protein AYL99_08698 [Fonsecaea erecta]